MAKARHGTAGLDRRCPRRRWNQRRIRLVGTLILRRIGPDQEVAGLREQHSVHLGQAGVPVHGRCDRPSVRVCRADRSLRSPPSAVVRRGWYSPVLPLDAMLRCWPWGGLPRDGDRPFACLAQLWPYETPRPASRAYRPGHRPSIAPLCPKQKVETPQRGCQIDSRLGRSVDSPPWAIAARAYIKDRFCRRRRPFYSGSAVRTVCEGGICHSLGPVRFAPAIWPRDHVSPNRVDVKPAAWVTTWLFDCQQGPPRMGTQHCSTRFIVACCSASPAAEVPIGVRSIPNWNCWAEVQ
jgi:hypothetical protein